MNKISQLRRRAGFQTQAELAEKAGVHPGTIALLESKNVKNPRINTIKSVAKALNLEFSIVFDALYCKNENK